MKQETLEKVKDLSYYKTNAEEDYLRVPISVLRYISQLEQEVERSYSEGEVLELLLKSKIETSNLYYEDMKEWFKQFKKK